MLLEDRLVLLAASSYARRAVLVAMLLLVAGFIPSLGGPGATRIAGAAPPEPAVAGTVPINLDFVPNDAQFVLALRPAEIAMLKSLDPLTASLEQLGMFKSLGLTIDAIEEVKFVATGEFAPGGDAVTAPDRPPLLLTMIRANRPFNWTAFGTYMVGPTREAIASGQQYFRAVEPKSQLDAYWLPDDRTIVLVPSVAIARTFSLRGSVNLPAWADRWKDVANSPAALMMKPAMLQPFLAGLSQDPSVSSDVDIALFRGAEVSGEARIMGAVACNSPEGAKRMQDILEKMIAEVRKQQSASLGVATAASAVLAMLPTIGKETKVTVKDNAAQLDMVVSFKGFSKGVDASRATARKNVSANKMKQIGIALQNYHDTYKHFPQAVALGPDGKTPHSWRLELLPFLDKQDVYDRYKMDEPWDSESNKALVKEAAELFSAPSDKPDETCAYFLVTGPGTLFDGRPKPQLRNVADGTSLTIGLVEARRPVPWTKPEDVECDPDKPLPPLGKFFDDGFHVGFLDASVLFLPTGFDEASLCACFTCAGGETIQRDPNTGLPRLAQ